MTNNQTKLNPCNPFFFTKNWKVGFFVFVFMPIIAILLLYKPYSSNFELSTIPLKVYLQILLFYLMLSFSYLSMTISQQLELIIDKRGIHQTYKGGMPFVNKNLSYSWQDIESIKIKKFHQKIEVKIKNQSKKLYFPFFFWEIKKSSVDLDIKELPKTKYGKSKFDIQDTAILKAINYWKSLHQKESP